MSGTNNLFNPTEIYNKWIKQNEEYMKGFEQFSQQMGEVGKMTDMWKRMNEQMESFNRQTAFMKQMNEGVQQMYDLFKSAMVPWQQRQDTIPSMLTGWASFKTGIGSNGRISIPESERTALNLAEGDLVQVIVLPVRKKEVNK